MGPARQTWGQTLTHPLQLHTLNLFSRLLSLLALQGATCPSRSRQHCVALQVPSPGLTAACRPLSHLVFHWLTLILWVRYMHPLEADGVSLLLTFVMLPTHMCRPVGAPGKVPRALDSSPPQHHVLHPHQAWVRTQNSPCKKR